MPPQSRPRSVLRAEARGPGRALVAGQPRLEPRPVLRAPPAPREPRTSASRVTGSLGYLAERPERNDILGIEVQDLLEHGGRLPIFTLVHQTAALNDVPARVRRAFLDPRDEDLDREFEVAVLAVHVGQGGEPLLGLLTEPLFELLYLALIGHVVAGDQVW